LRYTFEIATRAHDGHWSVLTTQSGLFSRAPQATARSIAERWIFEQAGQLRGGRLVIHGKRGEPPKTVDTVVRILILDHVTARRLAAAYIIADHSRFEAYAE